MSDGRRLLHGLAGVFAFCFIALGALYIAINKFPERFENFDTLVAIWVKKTETSSRRFPRVLVLGDSTAACGLYAPTFERALSVATLNSSPVEVYFDLKRRLKTREAPACAVMALSWDWEHYKHFFWRTFNRAGFYSPQELDEIFRVSEETQSFPATSMSRWKYDLNAQLYSRRARGLNLSDLQDALFNPPEPSKAQKVAGLVRNRGSIQLPAKLTVPPPEGDLPEGETSNLFRVYAEKIFELAQQHSIRIFFVEIPKTESEAAIIPHWFRESAEKYGIVMLKPEMNWSETDFSYPHHLRAETAIRLTEYVRGKIQNDCYR